MAIHIKRREFIVALGGAAVAWPLAARAQQPVMPVVGFLGDASADLWANYVRAFQQGLGETGYVEGRNMAIEYRWAEGRNERMSGLIADLLHRPVSVIAVPGSTPAALAVKAASTTVPIVFAVAADPVQLGLVASLNRPGGNATGVVTLNVEIAPKRLELLHELLPTATSFALLVNPANPALAEPVSERVQAAARTLGIKLHVLHASSERELDAVVAAVARLQAAGLMVGPDPFFNSRIEQLATLTSGQALPAVYQWREFTAAGGLLSYGSSITDVYRQAGIYTGRILKGEKPADLPVEQTTKVELFINLKTAKALGITAPTSILVRADEVIE
jgi:putative tryptophan/tyrosine transport system substrate-binding protein